MKSLIERLKLWLEVHVPDPNPFLKPGSVENLTTLPQSLRELYSLADGQYEGIPLFEIFYFMPAKLCLETKHEMDTLAKEESWTEGTWNSNWFPFAEDLSGDYLVVDNRSGKIFQYVHDDAPILLNSISLENFLEEFAQKLERNIFIFTEDVGIIDKAEYDRSPKRTFLQRLKDWKDERSLVTQLLLESLLVPSLVFLAVYLLAFIIKKSFKSG
ncbi:SMI1/KNR4 family protein [Leptospira sp. 201903070]|uniref:SMI1/KNR4 family protein n=1 Tax=Leptospira ainlahdjerensis TaxID=2810033 RepID=A0ABS2U7X1_9LEPT|nr:SMI1/KNR4 family protein [Leptospira ainlahdjerensis]MBM9576476.1 SMI1/KNR4 family protein [Leptospira ainlahdjerensis]